VVGLFEGGKTGEFPEAVNNRFCFGDGLTSLGPPPVAHSVYAIDNILLLVHIEQYTFGRSFLDDFGGLYDNLFVARVA